MEKEKIKEITIEDLVNAYNLLVSGIEDKAMNPSADDEARAYGGIVRAGKGLLVESLAKNIALIAWRELGGDPTRISFIKEIIKIPIKKDYIEKIKNPDVKKFIKNNVDKYFYRFKTDVHVHIDDKLVAGIECKAYTENAMMKRIMVDFTFLKQVFPDTKAILIQLESQLGGDYSDTKKGTTYGSFPTHTIMSYFDVDLNIITLLEGERKVDEPIHKQDYFKNLEKSSLDKAVNIVKEMLVDYLK